MPRLITEWSTADPPLAETLKRIASFPDEQGDAVVYDEGRPSSAQAEHIALHDPAGELLKYRAMREVVEQYKRTVDARDSYGARARVEPFNEHARASYLKGRPARRRTNGNARRHPSSWPRLTT